MKVKRYFAPDMRQAMRRVRDEIGPDAVILSNHRVAGGVEVVAAHENDYESAQQEFSRQQSKAQRRKEQVDVLTGGDSTSQLSSELQKTRMKIAAAEDSSRRPGVAGAGSGNHQLDQDGEEDLRSILASLKDRQRRKAGEAHQNFVRNNPDSMPQEPSFDEMVTEAPRRSEESLDLYDPPVEQNNHLIRSMQGEIEELKEMLRKQARASQVSASSQKPPLQRKLELLGVSDVLSTQLMSGMEVGLPQDKAWRNTLTRLSDSIPVTGEDFIERGGMVAFVGPTGVGKSTTIGKLAARYVLKYGSSGLALVTTDTFRIAAHEQLRTFGRILDVPVRVVDETNSLEEVLQSLKSKRLVLIDTAGLNEQEPHSHAQLEMLESVTLRLKKLLVVSCSSQRRVVEQAFNAYRSLGLNGCVLSKMDESGSLGEAISLIVEKRLPVTYVTDGQRIPDDIEVARKHELVSRAVVTAQRSIEAEKKAASLDSISKTG